MIILARSALLTGSPAEVPFAAFSYESIEAPTTLPIAEPKLFATFSTSRALSLPDRKSPISSNALTVAFCQKHTQTYQLGVLSRPRDEPKYYTRAAKGK